MDFKLHQSMSSANYAVSQLLNIEFKASHRMDQSASITTARKYLMDALDHLSSYQASLKKENAAVSELTGA